MDDFFTAFFKTGKLRYNNRHLVLKKCYSNKHVAFKKTTV